MSSAPATNLCSDGNASAVTNDGAGAWLWTCTPSGNGAVAGCYALAGSSTSSATGINGSCGSTIGTCVSGAATNVTNVSGAAAWTCAGSNGGMSASCPANSSPLGGPGGYSSSPVLNDSFGSNKLGANITSMSQFNPSTPYGSSGTGWDLWMKQWSQSECVCVNAAMMSDHLEIYPGSNGSDNMVSHFEFMPSGSSRYYIEINAATGAGGYNGGQTWPAFWFLAGNGPNDYGTPHSELDGMETYDDLSFGTSPNSSGLYTNYYQITSHTTGNAVVESHTILTNNNINVTYNLYGFELYMNGSNLAMDAYFNGILVGSLSQGIPWQTSPPAVIIGYNPGSTSFNPATMKIDYVRVWSK
jgi:hypothetical protein